MSNPVPVQIETCTVPAANGRPQSGVCGTCTKCGATASVPLTEGRGGPTAKRKAAIGLALEKLTEGCAHPLPWGVAPVHADRGIPKGVTLWVAEAATGRRFPVSVDAKGKLATVSSGVHPAFPVMVVPDDDEFGAAAYDFAAELVERGYLLAQVAKREEQRPVQPEKKGKVKK